MNPFSFPAIGVDISDESFKYVRLEHHGGRRSILFFGDQNLPQGTIEAGEIKDVGVLADSLSRSLRDYRSRFPYLILSLPEEKGYLRLIRMQHLPASEIRNALAFQLEEHIPYPPAELYFDFQTVKEATGAKKEIDVVITAYPKKIIESYMEAVTRAGFTPVIFELESQAVARAIISKGTTDAVLIGDIGRTRTTYSIVYRGVVHFTSTVKMGGRDIDAILRDSLHISDAQAQDIKVVRGLDFSSEEIIESLSPALSVLDEEAGRQIKFWDRRRAEGEPLISRVYLCGGDAHLRGLPEALSRNLGIPVQRARIWENVFDVSAYVPTMSAHTTLRYATAFGLALRGDDDLFR